MISVIKCVSVSGWSRTFSGTETRLYFAETIVSAATLYSQTTTAPRTLLASTLQTYEKNVPLFLRRIPHYVLCRGITLAINNYTKKYQRCIIPKICDHICNRQYLCRHDAAVTYRTHNYNALTSAV